MCPFPEKALDDYVREKKKKKKKGRNERGSVAYARMYNWLIVEEEINGNLCCSSNLPLLMVFLLSPCR